MLSHALVAMAALTINSPRPEIVAKNVPQLETEVGDISGYYTCKGMEAGGKAYNGVAVITRKGDVYVVQWVIGTGSTFTGIGIRQGNTFSASWALPNERGLVRGVNVYRVESAGGAPRLTGRWTSLPGNGVLQSETLSFLKQMDDEE